MVSFYGEDTDLHASVRADAAAIMANAADQRIGDRTTQAILELRAIT
jgi:hypothetical protein